MDLSELPLRVDLGRYRLINSIRVRNVPHNDPNLGVYQWDNHDEISYLQTFYPDINNLSKEKPCILFDISIG